MLASAVAAVLGLGAPASASAGVHFTAPVSYPGGAWKTVIGDFDGDGATDLAGLGASGVEVHWGLGDGRFEEVVAFDLGSWQASIATADFDADDIADLAVTTTLGVTVLLGNEDRAFDATDYELSNPNDVAVGDFDGNGDDDIAVSQWGVVTVLLGSGTGDLHAPSENPTGVPGHLRIAAGDFNGDGRDDVVASGPAPRSIATFLTNADGTLQSPRTTSLPDAVFSIVVARINGDVRDDAIITYGFPAAASALVAGTDGTLTAPVDLSLPARVGWQVAEGDFDDDGHLDVAVASGQHPSVPAWLSIVPGRGDGTFGIRQDFPAPFGIRPRAADDLDGDGFDDLVLELDDNVVVTLNAAGISFTPDALTFASTAVGATSGARTLTLTSDGAPPLRVQSITAGGDFRVLSQTCTGRLVPAKGTCDVTVVMAPTMGGPRSADLVIESNADAPTVRVPLSGTGLVPAQQTAPASGSQAVDETPPSVSMVLRTKSLRAALKGGVKIRLGTSEDCLTRLQLLIGHRLARRLGITTKGDLVVGRRTVRLTRSRQRVVTIELSRRARRGLRKVRQARFTLASTAIDGAGNTASRTKALRLRAPAR